MDINTIKKTLTLSFIFFSCINSVFAGNALEGEEFLWPNGIVYYSIPNDISSRSESRLMSAVQEINSVTNKTGIELQLCTTANNCNINSTPHVTLNFFLSGVCAVGAFGYQDDGTNTMKITDDCPVGTIIHEFGHVLGLIHENQRHDRNNYIKVFPENIQTGSSFPPRNDSTDRGFYDYRSIMHYGECTFSIDRDNCPPLIAIETPDNVNIGGAREFSDGDINTLNSMYITTSLRPNVSIEPEGLFNPDDIYSFTERNVSVVQAEFPGNNSNGDDPRDYKDFGLIYNDGDFNGDIENIEIASNPSGTLSLSQTIIGNFTFDFAPNSTSDSFSYRLSDSAGNFSDPVSVTLSTTAVEQTRTLTVTKTGSGNVSSSPAGISCWNDCSHEYVENTIVTLTAHPFPGYSFNNWTGSCSGTSISTTVTLNSNKTCIANFVGNPVNLTITKNNGVGTVTSTPSGISCGSDCSQIYNLNTQVTLQAFPGSGYIFDAWTGHCAGNQTPTHTITMSGDRICRAHFVPENLRNLRVSHIGWGTTTSTPTGINCVTFGCTTCSSDCVEDFNINTNITLRAIPASGWRFDNWSEDCSGNSTTTTVNINDDKFCRANFTRTSSRLTVTKSGSGTITSSPGGISCGTDCLQNYGVNSVVTLQANPAPGFFLERWVGDCIGSTSETINITMNTDKTCHAFFDPL